MSEKNWKSPNFDERVGDAPDMLILHYTGMKTAEEALARLCDPASKVSAHYVVEEDGCVHNLVPEDKRAWHAGISYWRGHTDINSRSIGIEIVNPGHEHGYRPFPALQIKAVKDLCLRLIERYNIAPENILGHSDIAPGRKQDPGELFPWDELGQSGIGIWPAEEITHQTEKDALIEDLISFGYNPNEKPQNILAAFYRHYYPGKIKNQP